MDTKKSIMVEVDESTQEIMNDIQESFEDCLTEGFSTMKDGFTDDIIKKLMGLDVFKMTPEQLRKLKEDTQHLINSVSPIESGIKAQQSAIATTQTAINEIGTKINDAKWADIRSQIDALKAASDSQNEQITSILTEIEKIQETLGIIVHLVTPFWKRWRKSDKNENDK